MNYRHLGRQETLHFGAWPEVGIAAARRVRDKAGEPIAPWPIVSNASVRVAFNYAILSA